MNFHLRLALASLFTAGLCACGGGSGSAASTPITGQLLEPISGLSFETSSGLKGTSTSLGQFSFRAGDRITLSIGKLNLGQTTAADVLTLAALVGTNTQADNAKLLNLMQILQALDEDKNPANGISISAATQSKLAALANTLDAQDLSDSDLQTRVVDVVFGTGVRTLVSETTALNAALAVESKLIIAGMPTITNYVIGGGVQNCSSFNGTGQSRNCGADWATIAAQDPTIAALGTANISFDGNYVRPTLTYTINQANIDKITALQTSIFRSTQKTSLTAALNARLADNSKPKVNLSFADFDGGKALFADGTAFWNGSTLADFDLVVSTFCSTAAPVNGTQCTLSNANIAAVQAATFATASDKAKVVLIAQNLQTSLGTAPIFYRRDASGVTATPNFRASFQAVKLAADGTPPVLGLTDGLNTLELAALRESFVNPNTATTRKIEARSVAFLSNTDSRDIYISFVQSARRLNGGNTPTIGVLTSATENPWADRDINVTALQSAGANVLYIPMEGGLRKALDENNACQNAAIYMANYSNSNSGSTNFHMGEVYPDIVSLRNGFCANNAASLNSTLSSLNGLFFAGGDQARHLETFISKDAGNAYTVLSPQYSALRTRFDAGQLVVSGTSAGAAVQSGGLWKGKKVPMLGGGYSWDVLQAGYAAGAGPTASEGTAGLIYTEGGLNFFKYGVLDQHFSQRTREGRLLRAVREAGLDYGFGVDENTSLVVGKPDASGKTTMTVLGAGGVFIADVRGSSSSGAPTAQYSISAVKAHYVSAGDRIEIDSAGELSVILGQGKPVIGLNASTPVVTATQVQEYGSSNYLKMMQSMASSGAAKAFGTTENSAGQSSAFSFTASRTSTTVMRIKSGRMSYTNVVLAVAPCPSNVCTAPPN
ncbi:cyanophycinase [Variovorax sp. PCZ-1]|uniref:cyanophycinase n=1 Tax=Variovorax sp. PCZ-1 TaxID=2835533 RepID=UPI0020BF4BB6|nr:cyanophycinase [Variovorax sp. PCZ-1]